MILNTITICFAKVLSNNRTSRSHAIGWPVPCSQVSYMVSGSPREVKQSYIPCLQLVIIASSVNCSQQSGSTSMTLDCIYVS